MPLLTQFLPNLQWKNWFRDWEQLETKLSACDVIDRAREYLDINSPINFNTNMSSSDSDVCSSAANSSDSSEYVFESQYLPY